MSIPVVALLLCVLWLSPPSYCVTIDYKAEYYSNVTLFCNHEVLNLPYTPFKIYWILPDESVLQPNDVSRREKYIVGKPPNYNLTIIKVNDDDFDRYYCVILWDNSIYLVHTILVDLELDGERFSEIYRRGVMIGGISAAATLTVLCALSLVYYFRYRGTGLEYKNVEEIRVMQQLDQTVKSFEEPMINYPETVPQSGDKTDDLKKNETKKELAVEINQSEDGFKGYENKALQIDNDSIVPYAESDIDKLPPYTVCDEFSETHRL